MRPTPSGRLRSAARLVRLFAMLVAALFPVPPAFAAETAPAATFSWRDLAGWKEESEAEDLELRDELIAANLSFLAALEKAESEAGTLAADDPRHPLAWSRVEYLAETSYRLLDETGEYEAFLKATAALKPEAADEAKAVAFDEVDAYPDDEDGGLVYESASGRRLLPTRMDGRMALVDAVTAEVVPEGEAVRARPAETGGKIDVSVPLVKARTAWLRALALERLGRAADAAREVAPLFPVREWLILGPLDQDLEPLSGIPHGHEELMEFLDPDLVVAGKNGPVRWREFSSVDPLGRLFTEAAFGVDDPAMAYALALVHSPANQPAVVAFGSNGPATLWINNAQPHLSIPAGVAMPGQEAFDVWLRRGWNVILVKTLSTPGSWRVAMRITHPDGSAFAGYVVPATEANLPRILHEARNALERSALERYYTPERGSELGGLSALSRRLREVPDDATANFYLGSLLAARRLMEGADRFDRELIFRRSIELSEGAPYFILMAARAAEAGVEGPDREENLRLLLLRLAADRGSAAAMVDIGRLYLDVMRQPRRAGEFAARAMEANQMSLRGGILGYDVAVAKGWKPEASALLARLGKRHPGARDVRLRTGRAALERGRYRTALSEFYALMVIDSGNDEALHGAVTALGRLGQTSAAVELLVRRLRAFPYDAKARLRLADLYRDLGRNEDALGVILEALRINPDDAAATRIRNDIVNEKAIPASRESGPAPAADAFDLAAWGAPATPPPKGWEYLYFHLNDRMERNGAIDRNISFAVKIYNDQAAAALRRLDFGLEEGLESGMVERLVLIHPDGRREELTPPAAKKPEAGFAFRLPPLTSGTVILAEVRIRRARIAFLGDYFGQIIPLGQPAPVRLSRYMFTSPRDRRLFFQPANGAPQAMMVETPDGQGITRIWEMNDLPAYPEEPYGPGRNSVMPCVQISSFGDWDEFARWYWRLIGTQYHAPPELRLLARSVAGEGSGPPLAKLDKAAEWVADNLGNREWEFGPYAFRPISVRAILSRRTADGKDRTLLLCLLAREYGLDSAPVLARSWEAWRPLPGLENLSLPLLDHFNYSLAAIDAADGGQVLFDASNPNRPPGVMPANLFGAPAVRLTPDSAEVMVVPDGGISGCEWEETAELTVDPDGSAIWEEKVKGSGTAAEALRSRFAAEESREKAWEAFLSGEGGDVSAAAVEFAEAAADPAAASFNGRARLRRLATSDIGSVALRVPPLPGRASAASGGREFPLSLDYLAVTGERRQDMLLPCAFRLSRRVGVAYPGEWRLVNPPHPMREEYPFGTLEIGVEESPGNIVMTFVLEIPARRIAAGDFSDFRRVATLAGRWQRPLLVWEKP